MDVFTSIEARMLVRCPRSNNPFDRLAKDPRHELQIGERCPWLEAESLSTGNHRGEMQKLVIEAVLA